MANFKVTMEILTTWQSLEEVSFDVAADSEDEARKIASNDYSRYHNPHNSWAEKHDTDIESIELECTDGTIHTPHIRCRQTPDMFAGRS